jgi:hypothetical protein
MSLKRWTIRKCVDCGERLGDHELHSRGYHGPEISDVEVVDVVPAEQLRTAEGEIGRLRAGISWARGLCTDEAAYAEIDAGLGRALDPPEGHS